MKPANLILTVLFMLIAGGQFAMADSDAMAAGATPAIKQMASILADLNHYPDESGKAALQQIIDDVSASESERTIAAAIASLEHKASAADKAKLQAVANDKNAPPAARDVANIVLNLNHKPSASDKEALNKIMQ